MNQERHGGNFEKNAKRGFVNYSGLSKWCVDVSMDRWRVRRRHRSSLWRVSNRGMFYFSHTNFVLSFAVHGSFFGYGYMHLYVHIYSSLLYTVGLDDR